MKNLHLFLATPISKAPPNISEFVKPTLSLKYPSLEKLLLKPPGYIL